MKTIYTFILCLFISTSQADFRDAEKNYKSGKFSQAYNEFIVLAKLGNFSAQYNVALMLAKGQGVDTNLISGYAWSTLAKNGHKSYSDLVNIIEKELSKEDLVKAQKLSQQLQKKYSHENTKVLLGPVSTKNEDSATHKRQIVAIKQIPPNYPQNMAVRNIQGWADIEFNIYPDGSVRDSRIISEVPEGSGFGVEALKAASKYKFKFVLNDKEIIPTEIQPSTQRIDYKLKGFESGYTKKQQAYLNKLVLKAKAGDVESQYVYATLYETALQKKGAVDGDQINQWLFNAAQYGIVDAQYRLGINTYFGKSCKVEKQKGLDWVMNAAQLGNKEAQYRAYLLLKNDEVINNSNQTAFYWLTQSAKNDFPNAQLEFAKHVSISDTKDKEQLKLATKYLKNYGNSMITTPDWYLTKALLEAKNGKIKKAQKTIKKAIRHAKKLEWDLTEFKKHQTDILNQIAS